MKRSAVAVYEQNGWFLAIRHPKRGIVLPGGGIEEHESPCEAAAREFNEETGVLPLCMGPRIYRWVSPGRETSFFVVLAATGQLVPSEEGEPVWATERDLASSAYATSIRDVLAAYREWKKEEGKWKVNARQSGNRGGKSRR